MTREDVKRDVESAFEEVLKTLDTFGREPAPWEQAALVNALCSMANGQYVLAAQEIHEVSRTIHRRPAAGSEQARVTRQALRLALTHVRIHGRV